MRSRNCLPFARNWVHPGFLVGYVLLMFLIFYVDIFVLCIFVPCLVSNVVCVSVHSLLPFDILYDLAVLTMSTGAPVQHQLNFVRTSKSFNCYLELYKNKFKNLTRTSKFKFSFEGLTLYLQTVNTYLPTNLEQFNEKAQE
jgi:hypothetical protein